MRALAASATISRSSLSIAKGAGGGGAGSGVVLACARSSSYCASGRTTCRAAAAVAPEPRNVAAATAAAPCHAPDLLDIAVLPSIPFHPRTAGPRPARLDRAPPQLFRPACGVPESALGPRRKALRDGDNARSMPPSRRASPGEAPAGHGSAPRPWIQ